MWEIWLHLHLLPTPNSERPKTVHSVAAGTGRERKRPRPPLPPAAEPAGRRTGPRPRDEDWENNVSGASAFQPDQPGDFGGENQANAAGRCAPHDAGGIIR